MASSTENDLVAQIKALRTSLLKERAKSARLEATLTEALEQQAAASEILRVISSSPADVQPVLDGIARSAMGLCEGQFCFVLRFDGDRLHFGACHGLTPEGLEAFQRALPRPAAEDTAAGRAILHRAVAHIADVQADPAYGVMGVAQAVTYRSIVAVPMLRDGSPIGAIDVARASAGEFPERQIELLKTFAAQAVIAVENVRLFKELEARNRALTESLEQQTATGEILRVISSSPTDIEPVFTAVAASAARLCDAFDAAIHRIDGDVLRLVAHEGPIEPDAVLPLAQGTVAGRVVRERRAMQVADLQAETEAYPLSAEFARNRGFRTLLSVPLLRGAEALGTITIRRTEVRPFTDRQAELLKTFADQAVIAIENVRLFKELESRNRALTESLEQQTATGEILRVISASPTDVQPVFDTVAESAARLCEAYDAAIFRLDGDRLRLVAHRGPIPIGAVGEVSLPMGRGTGPGRSVVDGQIVHVADLQAEVDEFPDGSTLARQLGFRTTLNAPLMREGLAIGTITVRRTEARLFTERQVALLQTFADQAVIAIENVRLFQELEARNGELRMALEQQTATSELLKVIGRSTFDLQPVFETLAENAVRLCDAERANIFQFDGQLLRVVATHNVPAENRAFLERNPIAPGRHSGSARAALERRTIHIHDVQSDLEYSYGIAQVGAIRTVLAIPMLKADQLLGVILIDRDVVRPFTDGQIALMETFADQAAIAIENARLLTELQVKNADLTEALEQQTATSEILRVISRSPTDVQPVFETIAANALRLCSATFSAVFRFDGELIHLATLHNVSDPRGADALRLAFPMPPGRAGSVARAILNRAVAYVPDVSADPEYRILDVAHAAGYMSSLSVPMLRGGLPIGVINVSSTVASAFSDKQIDLVKTFADQAVIAIENVRLFTELEARNSELRVALEQQTATSELLKVIGRSTFDLQPVFETLAENAATLVRGQARGDFPLRWGASSDRGRP